MAHGSRLRHRHHHGSVGQANDDVHTLRGMRIRVRGPRLGGSDEAELHGVEGNEGPEHDVPTVDRPHRGRAASPWMALVAVAVVAVIGGLVTSGSVDTWYDDLDKPGYNPPNSVFGPVWTVLSVLTAVAGWLVIHDRNRLATVAWWAQLGLNLAWTVVFFGAHQPTAALGVILVLLGALAVCTVAARRTSALAAGLLVPSLAWVAFAAVLNAGIVSLN
jgi:translocator protein